MTNAEEIKLESFNCTFINHKSSECICTKCGFVICRSNNNLTQLEFVINNEIDYPKCGFTTKRQQAIKDIKHFQETHIDWAEWFEENPQIEKKYIKDGEWSSAKEHREIVAKYDNVLSFLSTPIIKDKK